MFLSIEISRLSKIPFKCYHVNTSLSKLWWQFDKAYCSRMKLYQRTGILLRLWKLLPFYVLIRLYHCVMKKWEIHLPKPCSVAGLAWEAEQPVLRAGFEWVSPGTLGRTVACICLSAVVTSCFMLRLRNFLATSFSRTHITTERSCCVQRVPKPTPSMLTGCTHT